MQEQNISGLIFSDHLKSLMKDHGATQRDLADAVGVTQGAVSGWLAGAVPKMDKIDKIAAFLGINPDFLLNPEKYNSPITKAVQAADAHIGPPEEKQRVFEEHVRANTARMLEEIDWRTRALAAEDKLARIVEIINPTALQQPETPPSRPVTYSKKPRA